MGHYDVLGVLPTASPAEVRRAYLALAREHHPDRAGGSDERMRAVNAAWATLGDPDQRRRYDFTLTAPAPRPQWTASASGPAQPTGPAEVELDDLLDDRPIHGGVVRLPRWVAMAPPGFLVLSVVVGILGLVLRLAPVVAFAFSLGLLSALLFLLSPFIALAASRRAPSGGSR